MKVLLLAACVAAAAVNECEDGVCPAPASIALEYDSIEGQHLPRPIGRVHRHYAASYRANFPNEDRWDVHVDSDGVLATVMDGHGGWQVAEYVQTHLINNTRNALQKLETMDASEVELALTSAFVDTDARLKALLYPSFELGFGSVNRVGSCALLAYSYDDTLVIANAGDVRAVLAVKDEQTNTLNAVALSRDHNAKFDVEQAKLIENHPGENNIVMCRHKDACYVKGGLQPTRAFGDFAFKDKSFNGSPYSERRGGGRYIAPPYTPPYISSLPEIQFHQLKTSDQFVILGSDGVWEFVSNQEAVDLVNDYVSLGQHELASQGLIHHVIAQAASEAGFTFDKLAKQPPGRKRRNRHDDTTVVIIFFS